MIKMKIQNCGNTMVHAGAFAGRPAVPATSELLKLCITLGIVSPSFLTNAFVGRSTVPATYELLKLCVTLGIVSP